MFFLVFFFFSKNHKLHFYRFQDNKEFVCARNVTWLSNDLNHSSVGYESANDVEGMYFSSLKEHLKEIMQYREKYIFNT